MKRTLLLALVVLLCWSGLTMAEDGLSIAFMPDKRAPSLSIAGTHSLDLGIATLGAKWEFGAWTYIGPPPKGYGPTFYVIDITPMLQTSLWHGWDLTFGLTIEYRTNLPGRILYKPIFEIWHSW